MQRVVVVSSVLFTITFLFLLPASLQLASTWRRLTIEEPGDVWVTNYLAPSGFSGLATILIVLIVAWTGYLKGTRWTWFVMFVVVWVRWFPVMIVPLLLGLWHQHERGGIDWYGWFWGAVKGPGLERTTAEAVILFLLMLVALFLPIRSFLQRRPGPPSTI